MSHGLLTVQEYAQLVGLSAGSVHFHCRNGLPFVEQDGRRLIDPDAASAWRARYLSRDLGGHRPRGSRISGDGAAVADTSPPSAEDIIGLDPAADPASYIRETEFKEARRQRECAKALLLIRQAERISADWVHVDDVQAGLDTKFQAVRERLLAIAGAVAGPCAGQSAGRIKSAVMRAINEALEDLSRSPGGGPKRRGR